MKTFNTIVLFIFCLLVLTNCGTTTSTTTVTPEPVKETPPPTISVEEKAELKEELKEELKNEIKKELEIEQAGRQSKPPVRDVEINEPKQPVKPPKPPKPTVMDISTAQNVLVGAWQWIETRKSIRGVGNSVTTPSSLGFEKTAVFKQGGVCEILLNNIPAGTYQYTISGGTEQLFINFTSADNNTQHMENGPILLEDNKFEILGTYNDRGANIKFQRM